VPLTFDFVGFAGFDVLCNTRNLPRENRVTTLPTRRLRTPRQAADSRSSGPTDAGLHAEVRDMVSGMSDFLVSRLKSRYNDERSPPGSYDWDELSATVIPTLLADAFENEFIGSSELARRRRAMLAHLLSTAELMSLPGKVVDTSASLPAPRATGSEPETDELTSEEAAKFLHVSRTHLNTLVDEGKLGEIRHTEGGHRRSLERLYLRIKTRLGLRSERGWPA
jgi:excisionase family DNA binding protein